MTSLELKSIREKEGLTQEQAARKIGVSFVTWNKWENEKAHPSAMAVQLIKKAFCDEK